MVLDKQMNHLSFLKKCKSDEILTTIAHDGTQVWMLSSMERAYL